MATELNEHGPVNRRQFLVLTAVTLVAGIPTIVDSDPVRKERVVNAGPAIHYAADGVYGGFLDQGFFLVRKGDKLIALSSFCTHRKCKLTAESDHSFTCLCHGSTFSPNGDVTKGPARRDLPAFPTYSDEKGQLFVRVQ